MLEGNDELRDTLDRPAHPGPLAASRSSRTSSTARPQPTTTSASSRWWSAPAGSATCPAIIDELVAIAAREANKEVAEVRSAIDLTDDQKTRLAAALGKATGKQVEVKVIVDPTV